MTKQIHSNFLLFFHACIFFLQFTFPFFNRKKNLQEDIQLIPTINVYMYTQIYIEFISFSLYPIYHFILMGFKLFSFLWNIRYIPIAFCHRRVKYFWIQDYHYKSVLHVLNIERHRFDCWMTHPIQCIDGKCLL